MTEKMTRKEALEFAINTISDYEGECEAIEVLKRMIASIDKQAARPKTPSRASIENDKLADDLVGKMVEYDKPVDTKWITEHVKYILSPQKATAVAKVALRKGDIIREVDDKKHVWYRLAE